MSTLGQKSVLLKGAYPAWTFVRRISLPIVSAYFAQEWFHQNAFGSKVTAKLNWDRVIQMGYSTGLRLHAPAVMDLNMRAASWAMLLLRHVLEQFLYCPLPHSIRES